MSEIDDIFAKRPVASTSAVAAPIKKKKKEKRAAEKQGAETDTASSSCKKRPAPETVIDPSTTRPPPLKKPKVDKAPAPSTDDTERFKDSRGSGPRRKTEEGWSIYKEAELGIGDEGGDTPLCPFDCDCCF